MGTLGVLDWPLASFTARKSSSFCTDPPPPPQVAGLRGALPARAPTTAQNVLIFMQFLGKFGKIVCWHPLLRRILDPPLRPLGIHPQRWPLKWAVHILLECILVINLRPLLHLFVKFLPCKVKFHLSCGVP